MELTVLYWLSIAKYIIAKNVQFSSSVLGEKITGILQTCLGMPNADTMDRAD